MAYLSDLNDAVRLSNECYKKYQQNSNNNQQCQNNCSCSQHTTCNSRNDCCSNSSCKEHPKKCCCIKPPCKDQSKNDLLESIALVEAALAHILNAEGEKLQKAIKIADNICDLLEVDQSVQATITNVNFLEQTLVAKLQAIKCL